MVDRRPDGRAGIHPRIVGGAQARQHVRHPVPFQVETDIGVRLVGDRCRRAEAGDKPCVVISTTEPIVSACKGAKMYRILPIGAATMITIEERHIKKARGV